MGKSVAAPVVATIGTRHVDARAFLAASKYLGVFGSVLDHLVRRSVVLDRARQMKLVATTEESQAEADAYRRVLGLHSAKDTDDWLKSIGYSLDDFELEMELRVVSRKKRESVGAAEVDAFFNEHRSDFDQAKVAHLVVKDHGLAKELIQQVRDEKKDFRQLALKHSIDETTKEACGYLGWLRRGAFEPEVAAKVFSAKPGDCVGPNKLGDQAHQVVYVHEVRPATLDDAAREAIREALLGQWVEGLLAETKVEVAPLS